MIKEEVRQLATEFRGMLATAIDSGLDTHCSLSKGFPRGCCDDSSLLLAAFLTDNGHPGALRVHGEHGGSKGELGTHVWLNLSGVLIDITGSQFNEDGYSQPDVLVVDKCDFLATFEVEEEPSVADFREKFSRPIDHVRRTRGYFNAAYTQILTHQQR